MHLRVLYVNTHVGQSLFQGGMAWALEEYDPDVVLAVEVQRPRARLKLRALFGPLTWSITGLWPPSTGPSANGSMVMVRRRVLKRKRWWSKPLTEQRIVNGGRDKWHPTRRLVGGVFKFRANPEVEVDISADHAWTYAGFSVEGSHEVPTVHRAQVLAFAADAEDSIERGHAVLRGGDYNGPMQNPDGFQRNAMRNAGLHPLAINHLDALFGSQEVAVVAGTLVKIPKDRLHTDHDGLLVDVKVREQ